LQGAYLTARAVVAHDGVRGLYKGFGTVVFGMFPARMVRRLLCSGSSSCIGYEQDSSSIACHHA
jgi:hypothetical protein